MRRPHPDPYRPDVRDPDETPSDYEPESYDDLCRTCGGAIPCPFHTRGRRADAA